MKILRATTHFLLGWKLVVQVVITLSEVAICQSKMQDSLAEVDLESGIKIASKVASELILALQTPSKLIIVTDGRIQDVNHFIKELSGIPHVKGIATINIVREVYYNGSNFGELDRFASEVRFRFGNNGILVVSNDAAFLWDFANHSLQSRLVSRDSKLFIIGNLMREDLQSLTEHWIYSMMHGIFVVPSSGGLYERWDIFSYQPFTEFGTKLTRVGIWTTSDGVVFYSSFGPFPQKFSNLHGTPVNVSVLPYEPYWTEETLEDETVIYSGTDKLMLDAMASTLNFSIRLVPASDWDEIIFLVSNRSIWTTPMIYYYLPPLLELVDYTRTYEHDATFSFVMVKPALEPKWQSLYYPLSSDVWISTLGAIFVVSLSLYTITKTLTTNGRDESYSYNFITMGVFGMLIAQSNNNWKTAVPSIRFILALWLFSSYVISTTYKGNLVASLVAPKYPSRPETLEELVKAVKKVTIPSWGQDVKEMLLSTGTQSSQALGNMMDVGYELTDGLTLTYECRYPYIDSNRAIQRQIALQYTEADGTSPFYVSREGVITYLYGWLIPHDAPFKANLDFVVTSLIEGGIYDKWMGDWLDDARSQSRRIKRLEMEHQIKGDKESGAKTSYEELISKISRDDSELMALTIVHFQGPLLIWVIGSSLAGLAFISEYLVSCYSLSA